MSGVPSGQPRRVRAGSRDGTELAVEAYGSGDGVPVLLVDAVGAARAVWRPVRARLGRRHIVLAWDLRGLFASGPPAAARVDPAAQAEDALAVLDHFGVDRAAVVSWGNGARIALELASGHPGRVDSLALVCGGYARPIVRLVRYLEPASVLPGLAGIAKHFPRAVGAALGAATARPELAGLIRQSGIVGATADTGTLVELARGLASCDPRTLLETYEAVSSHASASALARIAAPTLLVAGERDAFTSRRATDDLARAIPGARVVVYPGTTHYLPIEAPDRLADDLHDWFTTRGDPVRP